MKNILQKSKIKGVTQYSVTYWKKIDDYSIEEAAQCRNFFLPKVN